ncbi:MAG TPA: DUF4239 domain-containing protein [Fimbriimonadaceae bacterium]|nr:DUF4239 domain-containing protein [Fimbriimonadaceae bacterium]HRJ97655.1 DUF4239 domain-containing protein [Fimbriimonadaceae bacterium]
MGHLSGWIAAPLLIVVVASASVWFSLLVRRRHALEKLIENNEIAGFKFGVVGVLYAVILGLAVVAVWDDYKTAQATSAMEANDVADIYRDSASLDRKIRDPIHHELRRYAKAVIEEEWPTLHEGLASVNAEKSLDHLFPIVLGIDPIGAREQNVADELVRRLNSLADHRRGRILDAQSRMPSLVWAALIAGGAITISFTFFFGNRNARAHSLMTALLSGFITLLLYVIHDVDSPYSGDARLEPDAMKAVQTRIASDLD